MKIGDNSKSTIQAFTHIEIKHTLYLGENCLKKFGEFLREQAKNIIDFEEKKNGSVNKRRTKITSKRKRNVTFAGK